MDLSSPAPVLADLFFPKIWMGRRFTAPGCEPVCCDGNGPMPFARGSFGYAMCSDAFQYIWTKRLFIGELARVVDGRDAGAVAINHTHNQLVWSPSHGQPLSPKGYEALFETIEPRLFAEARLFADVVNGGPLDLSRSDTTADLERDPALTIVASRHPGVYARHAVPIPTAAAGEFRVNPLYVPAEEPAVAASPGTRLRLRFPSEDYEQEYGACREYLPEEVALDPAAAAALATGRMSPEIADLVRRKVIVDLPKRYY